MVTDEIEYLTADEEDAFIIAQANAPLDEEGRFIQKRIVARYADETIVVPAKTWITWMYLPNSSYQWLLH